MFIIFFLLLGIGYFYFFYKEPSKTKTSEVNVQLLSKLFGGILLVPAFVVLAFMIFFSFCSMSGGIVTSCFGSKALSSWGELQWPIGLFVVPLAIIATPVGVLLLFLSAWLKAKGKNVRKR